jgi:hypothetical protein
MIKKFFASSVAAFTLVAIFTIPHTSFAGKTKRSNEEPAEVENSEAKRRRTSTPPEDSSDAQEKGDDLQRTDTRGIASSEAPEKGDDLQYTDTIDILPSEILVHIFSWCDSRRVEGICKKWYESIVVDSPSFIKRYSEAQKEVDNAQISAQFRPSDIIVTDAEETVATVLRQGHPFHALLRFLKCGKQDDLIDKRDHYVPFMRQAVARLRDPSPGLAYLLSRYPRVFHAFRASLLEELSTATERLQQSDTSYTWTGNLLSLLSRDREEYLLENIPVFEQLAPFFVKEIKKHEDAAHFLGGLSGETYNILLPHFGEFFNTADDFKKYFPILEDPLTFAYVRTFLRTRLESSEDYRIALGEIPFPVDLSTQLKHALAILTLRKDCGDEKSAAELTQLMKHLFNFDDEQKWPDGFLDGIILSNDFARFNHLSLCFYCFHDHSWPLIYDFADFFDNFEVGRELDFAVNFSPILRRFVMVTEMLVPLIQNADARKKVKDLKSWFAEHYAYNRMHDIKSLNLHVTADVYYELEPVVALPFLNRFSRNSMFTQVRNLLELGHDSDFENGFYPIDNMLGIVWDDAQLYLLNSAEDFEGTIRRLDQVLSHFQGKEIEIQDTGYVGREDLEFLRSCFQTCVRNLSIEGLLDSLVTHLDHVRSYFLDIRYLEGKERELTDHKKFFYQKDTLSRFLQVLKRVGYDSLEQPTKLRIVHMLRDYLLLANHDLKAVLKVLDSASFNSIEAFKRMLFLHDTLLNDILKDNEEAKKRYQEMRLYSGVDLSDQGEDPMEGSSIADEWEGKDPIEANEIKEEGEGKDLIEGNSLMDEGKGKGKGKGKDLIEENSRGGEEEEMDVDE